MVLEDSRHPAQPVWPVWLTITVLSTGLFVLSWSTANYHSIWYTCIIAATFAIFSLHDRMLKLFIVLFLFRYVRLIVNLTAFCFYKPVALPKDPELTAEDATVIVPTVEPYGEEFKECIQSIHANGPARIIIVTAGTGNHARAVNSTAEYFNIMIKHCHVQNKRVQLSEAISEVHTPITVLCDDHVFWPKNFLPCVIAPFEDPGIGCVGTNKRVRRTVSNISLAGFWNVIGCLYLERNNFEVAATNTIDGGVFCISGRTSAHRTEILKDESFLTGFTNEHTFFGLVGPLNADDDNFITRWIVDHKWKIKIQSSEDACIETTLGEYPKFLHQCTRWARTNWRSVPRSLLSYQAWRTQPWCIYSVFLTRLVNFALLYDTAMLVTLWLHLSNNNSDDDRFPRDRSTGMLSLALWILGSKLVKPWPHFFSRRHGRPRDLVYLPGYILFGYFHSIIKVYALLTFWVTAWGSRRLVDGEGRDGAARDGAGGGDAGADTGTEKGTSGVVIGGNGGDTGRDHDA